MNPENVTTSQLLGSFTAKHWAIAFSTLFTIIGAAVTGGYWAGQKITETQVARLQAKLEISQSEIKRLSTVNGQWQDAYNKAQELITKRDQEVTQLKTHLDKENSCSFIHS